MNWLQSYLIGLGSPAKRRILLGVDVVLLPFAYIFTLLVQQQPAFAMLARANIWVLLGVFMVMVGVISHSLGIPRIRLNAYDAKGMGWIAVMAALAAATGAALHVMADVAVWPGAFIVFGIVYFLASSASRVIMLEVLTALYRRQYPRCRVLIYGAGNTGMQLARALAGHERIEVVAFADDNPALQGLTIAGLPVLRGMDIERVADDRRVDRVLLAMPSLPQAKLTQMARRMHAIGLEVQALPSFAQLIGEDALVDKLVPLQAGRVVGRDTFDSSSEAGCSCLVGRSVLVSGGGGSIGLELCRQVINCKPSRLVIVDLSELALYEAEKTLSVALAGTGIEIVPVLGSVTDARLLRRVLNDWSVDVVLHAAAYKHVPMVETNALVGMANNVLGTWTLARAALEAGCERFILISSDKAVRPTNIMGASKRLAELVVQDLANRSRRTVFAMVRFGNVLGSSGSVVPLFEEQVERGGPVTVTHREMTRYFMTPREAVSLVLMAGSFAEGGEVFVLDMGTPERIWDLARRVIREKGFTVRDEANPGGDIEIVETHRRLGEKLHEELLIGEGHMTTPHEKIFSAREEHLSEIEVAAAIRALREAVATGDDEAARAVARRWVDGYSPESSAPDIAAAPT